MSLLDATLDSVRQLVSRLERRFLSRSTGGRQKHRNIRRLRSEALETRQLLAADMMPFAHNHFDPEDVNDDGVVAPIDALMVINSMNRNAPSDTAGFIDVNNDGFRSPMDALMVINRLNRQNPPPGTQRPPTREPIPSPTSEEVRSIDGTNNNLQDTSLGSANTPLLRVADADYADGISEPAGAERPRTSWR